MRVRKRIWLAVVVVFVAAAFSMCVPASAYAASQNKIVTKNGKKYYYDAGSRLVKGKYGYRIGKNYYRISKKGVLTKISDVEGRAGEKLNKYYGGKYTNDQRLKKAFKIAAEIPYYTNSTKVPDKQKPEEYFGMYGFKNERGDCNVQAAAFYWMAKSLGYKVKFVQGYVPDQVSETKVEFGSHAWCTIKIGKKNYVFDPNYGSLCMKRGMYQGLMTGYKFVYGTKNTYRYFDKDKKEIHESTVRQKRGELR